MNATRPERDVKSPAAAGSKSATMADSGTDSWAEPDGPVPPRPKNRIVRAGVTICLIGFVIAILGVAQLAEQKSHATPLAHFTHKTGLLTMLTGFVAMLFGFRGTWTRDRMAKSAHQNKIPASSVYTPELDWRDTPWKTS